MILNNKCGSDVRTAPKSSSCTNTDVAVIKINGITLLKNRSQVILIYEFRIITEISNM